MEIESHYENLFLPDVEINVKPNKEWNWIIKTGAIVIAKSCSNFKSRSECVKNLLEIEKALRELKLQNKIK